MMTVIPPSIPFTRATARAALLLAAAVLAGCAVGPDYRRPEVALPAQFPGEGGEAALAQATVAPDWWTQFGDERLTALVQRALAHNADVRQAVARVEQAEALLAQADAARWPGVDGQGSAARSRSSATTGQAGGGATTDRYRLALSTGFELDFWGRLRRASEAARAQALATRYAQEVVRQTVAGLVVQGDFGLRTLDEQIALTRETLRTREEALRLLRLRLDNGLGSRLEVAQAEGLRAEAAVQLLELERQRAGVHAQLALLVGEPGLVLAEGRVRDLPRPPVPPAGLPSVLLERRPDVRQAEQALVSAQAQIGVARAALFPSIALTGLAGGESAELSELLRGGSRIWTLGLGVDLPIFDAGLRRARVEQAEARQREALAAYQGAVQAAFKDVSDALANLRAARASEPEVLAAEGAARQALVLARRRYDAGYAGYLELLDAERTANAAQLQTLSNRRAQLAATVDVFKALGGGWTPSGAPLVAR
ncbi:MULTISPECIES: efflux transporter outer membrane subunit [unclassified Tepidimonas]|uniref:efflux transporter outer membrane subunit n=1 Tax=unclassified Tepidimonas TaxID=2631705 RepID=UPI003C7DD1D4